MSNWTQPPGSPDPYQSSGYGSQPSATPYGQPSASGPGGDPYATDPYATDPYAADPYAAGDPYQQGAAPYADPYGQPTQPYGAAVQPYGAYNPYAAYGALAPHPGAPYGVDPKTGLPFSSKTKIVAGLLQIFLGAFGVGRFYTGHYGIAIAQIIVTWVTLGFGAIWPLIDGIIMLAGDVKDSDGYPLRP